MSSADSGSTSGTGSGTLVAIRDLSFSYPQSAAPLFEKLSAVFPRGFTAVVGANGSGKSTLLRLMASKLQADSGTLSGITDVVYCEQRTDDAPPALAGMMEDWEAEAFELRGRLQVPDDALSRWTTLSHGERKRVQIACALWQQPSLLLIDEPTNHIDGHARELLADALQRFTLQSSSPHRNRFVGVLVSHDRDLLDALCSQTLWLQGSATTLYPGAYSAAREQRAQAQLSQQRSRDRLRSSEQELRVEVATRRDTANRANAQRSKRGIAPKDSDARERIDRARVSGKDGSAGKQLRQLSGRMTQAEAALGATEIVKEYTSGVWLGGEVSRADALVRHSAGILKLSEQSETASVSYPDLLVRPADRVAITGPNGTGKSTLVNMIFDGLKLPEQRVVFLPQELTAVESTRLLDEVKSLRKHDLGRVMSIVSRLGSRPAPLLASKQPSPGEVRKLLLALGIVREPHLLILDEPTNHLDVVAIESLQEALCECPCGLIVVSHDRRLIEVVTQIEWALVPQTDAPTLLVQQHVGARDAEFTEPK